MGKRISKSERTLECYMKVGAELRLIKLLSVNVQDSVRCLTTLPCVRHLDEALSIIYDVCAELEDGMRYDLAQLTKRVALSERDYNTVFRIYSDSHRCTSETRLRKPKRTIYISICGLVLNFVYSRCSFQNYIRMLVNCFLHPKVIELEQ